MTCVHDLSEVEIISRVDGHTAVEVDGQCPSCGATLYGYVELEVIER